MFAVAHNVDHVQLNCVKFCSDSRAIKSYWMPTKWGVEVLREGDSMNKRKFLESAGAVTAAAAAVIVSRSAQAQTPATGTNVVVTYHSVSGNT
jgi:hypothetical protein